MSAVSSVDTADALDGAHAEEPLAPSGAAATGALPANGLLEVLDRSGAVLQSMKVLHWPLTVGRALHADLVLTDSHVAGEHLRIDLPATEDVDAAATPHGAVIPGLVVHVLDTVNGVRKGRRQYGRDSHFDWNGEDELTLGRFRLRLRLAQTALAPEQVLAAFRWRRAAITLALLLAFAGLQFWGAWLGQTEPNKFGIGAARMMAIGAAFALGWAGLAALLTKLFTGHPQFWRHLRIVLTAFVAAMLATSLLSMTAFAFGWTQLGRLGAQVDWAAIGIALLVQEWVVSRNRRRWVQLTIAGSLAALGVGAAIWYASKDTQEGPRLAALYPPGWRLVAPVPVSQWVEESRGLRERLDVRLRNDDESDDSGDGDAADEGEDEN
ncbi:MAG: hypothetical protein JWP29_3836 [Rhodoferax sp.]|nr:hypothetical protein [Rhodoferax sp.]